MITYKGYEIRRTPTKFVKGGTVLEVEAWGIYANGDYRGSVKTQQQAMAYIDKLTQGVCTRPPERTRAIQRTDYDDRGHPVRTITYREDV